VWGFQPERVRAIARSETDAVVKIDQRGDYLRVPALRHYKARVVILHLHGVRISVGANVLLQPGGGRCVLRFRGGFDALKPRVHAIAGRGLDVKAVFQENNEQVTQGFIAVRPRRGLPPGVARLGVCRVHTSGVVCEVNASFRARAVSGAVVLVRVERFPIVRFRGRANRDLQGASFRKLNRSEARTARSRLNPSGLVPDLLRETSYRNPSSTSEWGKHFRSLAAMKAQRGWTTRRGH